MKSHRRPPNGATDRLTAKRIAAAIARRALFVLCLSIVPTAANAERSVSEWNAQYRSAANDLPLASPARRRLLLAAREYAAAAEAPAGVDSLPTGVAFCALERWPQALASLEKPHGNPLIERYRLLLRAQAYRGLGDASRAAAACDDFLAAPRMSAPWLETMLLDIVAAVAPGEWDRFAALLPAAVPSALALSNIAAWHLERGEFAAAEPLIRRCATAPSPPPEEETVDGFASDSALARFELGTLDALVGLLAAAGNRPAAISAGRTAARRFGAPGRLVEARALERAGSPRKASRIYRRLHHSRESVQVKRDALYRMAVISLEAGDADASELYRTFGMYYPGDSRSAGALDTAARIEIARGRTERAVTILSELRRRSGLLICREAALAESVLLVRAGRAGVAKAILGAMLDGGDRRLEAWVLYWLFRVSEGEEAKAWQSRLLEEYPASACARYLRVGGTAFIVPERQKDPRRVVSALAEAEHAAFELLVRDATPSPALRDDPRYGAWRYALETGLLELGSAIGDLILDFHGGDERARLAIYRDAREAGLLRIALRAIIGLSANRPGRNAAIMPVAYEQSLTGVAAEWKLPPALLLAVMREESLFDRSAISRAGARGLMQLMPATGRWIGGKLGLDDLSADALHDPAFSLRAGGWYLRFLLDRGDDSIVAAVASYNAGHGKMRNWRKTFIPSRDPMAAVEMIGPAETRRYTRRVLDAMSAYGFVTSGKTEE